MNALDILERVGEQSFVLCFTDEDRPQRITRQTIKEAVGEIVELLESAPAITNANTIGYIDFKKKIEELLGK